jgi:hypothetical protein
MSIDAVILAKQPLPYREGGWQGYRGPAPLWYAAVSMKVTPYEGRARPDLEPSIAAQGGVAEFIWLNWHWSAGEFASDYCVLLCQLTGGTVVVEGRPTFRCPEPIIASVAELEQRLYRVDVTELDCSRPEARETEIDDELFELKFGRPRPQRGPKPPDGIFVLKKELTESDLPAIDGVRLRRVSFMEWARQDYSRLAQVLVEGGRGITLSELVQVVWFEIEREAMTRSSETAFERLTDKMLDVHKARVLYTVW